MIGLLRFIGLFNAAVWFGAAVFSLLGAGAALSSQRMMDLIGAHNYPFFSVEIGRVVLARYYQWHLVLSAIALLHVMAEWLYFGKYPRKFLLGLLFGLCLIGLAQDFWLQPRLRDLHQLRRSVPAQQQALGHAYSVTQAFSGLVNIVMLGGLGLYLWRISSVPEGVRFVSAGQFRS